MKRRLLSGVATALLFAALVLISAALGIEFGLNVLLVVGVISLLIVTFVWRYVLPPERVREREQV